MMSPEAAARAELERRLRAVTLPLDRRLAHLATREGRHAGRTFCEADTRLALPAEPLDGGVDLCAECAAVAQAVLAEMTLHRTMPAPPTP